jgi:hypothetical protein
MGDVLSLTEENLDIIIGVCSVNYGKSYAHFSDVFFVCILMLDKMFQYEGFILR